MARADDGDDDYKDSDDDDDDAAKRRGTDDAPYPCGMRSFPGDTNEQSGRKAHRCTWLRPEALSKLLT